jgi:hypothetical protein
MSLRHGYKTEMGSCTPGSRSARWELRIAAKMKSKKLRRARDKLAAQEMA